MQKIKRGFTLFELLVVVVLITIIYGIIFSDILLRKNKIEKDTLLGLKSFLKKTFPKEKKIVFIKFHDCKKAAVKIDGKYKEIDGSFIEKDIKVYKIDTDGEKIAVEFPPVAMGEITENVCFRFEIFPNNSSSSYIVKNGEFYYYLHPLFEERNRKFKEFEKAKTFYLKKSLLPVEGKIY
jgi:prepilin-type N-terminal cleavage/methylation domain-containing protein